MTKPYTYHLFHKPTNKHYYGVRWARNCSPSDLWVSYFTSSKQVHSLIKEYGKESFYCEVRKTFSDKISAISWEEKVLRRLKVNENNNWLNKNISGSIVNDIHPRLGKQHSAETKAKISKANSGRKHSPEAKEKMSKMRSGKNHWNFGKIVSESTRQKISNAIKALGPRDPKISKRVGEKNRGRKHSPEAKEKMRKAALLREERKRIKI